MSKVTEHYNDTDVRDMVRQYLDTALWAGTDEEGEPLDRSFEATDIAGEAESQAWDECEDFLGLLDRERVDYSAIDPGQMGHDFFLTRNHHGAGFWDRGLGDLGDVLTKWAESFGESDLYAGDDGRLYF